MAVNKSPSIYDDRSTIGSSDELDEYGVWVKVEPVDLIKDLSPAEESLSGEADLSDIPPEEDDTDFIEDLNVLLDDEDADIDDLEALQEDIQVPEEEPAAVPEAILPQEEPPVSDLSTQLLMKIADELASIKDELSSLKDELSVIRSERPAGNADENRDGFFDGEDDDKIALTGDELNNILHTADFTEENGADAGENLDDDFISLETGEAVDITPPEENTFDIPEENTADTPVDIPPEAIAALETRDTEDLKALRESGVEPMTAPPEDTSYLEEAVEEPSFEPVSEDTLSLIDLDDMGAVPEETEKTEDTLPAEENLFEEVSFDELAGGGESIDLSTIEDAVVTTESEPETAVESPETIELPPPDLPAEGLLEDTVDPEELDIDIGSLPDIPLDDLSVEIPEEAPPDTGIEIPSGIKNELISVLEYMDKLLESLPEEKIEEFAQSEHYVTYKKLFDELGIE